MSDTDFSATRHVQARLLPGWAWSSEPLAGAQLRCQKGGELRSSADCCYCPRFLGWEQGPGRDEVTVHCRWTAAEPVRALMTRAVTLLAVHPLLPISAAEELARAHGVRHLVVLVENELVGVLCRCVLVPSAGGRHDQVVDRMRPPITIPPTATLGEALERMNQHHVGCLPVLEGGHSLVGIITRGDLRRIGVPEELLQSESCAACGSTHGVRTDPLGGQVEFCLDCLDRAHGFEEGDLGEGD